MKFLLVLISAIAFCSDSYAGGKLIQSTSYVKKTKDFSPMLGIEISEPITKLSGLYLVSYVGMGVLNNSPSNIGNKFVQLNTDIVFSPSFFNRFKASLGGGWVSNDDLWVDPNTFAHLDFELKLW